MVERGRPQMTIWRMRIAYWIPQTTNTHSKYVILNDFPLQPVHQAALIAAHKLQLSLRFSLRNDKLHVVTEPLAATHCTDVSLLCNVLD